VKRSRSDGVNNFVRYYSYIEIVLYLLTALLCALRARTAGGAYGASFGIFVLWTVPAAYFDGYLGRDIPGIGYLVIAPFYAAASPLMHLIIWRIWKRPPKPSRQSSGVGPWRLDGAIHEQVQREFAAELAAATDYWARAAVEKKIEDEVRRRMKP